MEIYFWNLHQSEAALRLAAEVVRGRADCVFVVCEYHKIETREECLGEGVELLFTSRFTRLAVLASRAPIQLARVLPEYFVATLSWNALPLTIACFHLNSKLEMSESAQQHVAQQRFQLFLQDRELEGWENLVILGDFNFSPYEPSLRLAQGLFSRNYCSRGDGPRRQVKRTIQFRERQTFYNPIASCWGDRSPGPPGTYYYEDYCDAQAWHVYDQILVELALVKYLPVDSCRILDTLEWVDLSDELGRPNHAVFSDHYPIVIKFEVET